MGNWTIVCSKTKLTLTNWSQGGEKIHTVMECVTTVQVINVTTEGKKILFKDNRR